MPCGDCPSRRSCAIGPTSSPSSATSPWPSPIRAGLDEAERFSNVAIALARATDDDFTLCECLLARSSFLADPSRLEEALGLSEEAAQLARADREARRASTCFDPSDRPATSSRVRSTRARPSPSWTDWRMMDTPIARADLDFARWRLRARGRPVPGQGARRMPDRPGSNAERRVPATAPRADRGARTPSPIRCPMSVRVQITEADLTATLLTGQALLREWMAGAAAEHQPIDVAG